MIFAGGVLCGVGVCVLVSALWSAWRLRRELPPATRKQIDRAARANRPDIERVRLVPLFVRGESPFPPPAARDHFDPDGETLP